VSVSKLSCPACWDYFDILSEKHRDRHEGPETRFYKIRGRHSTVFPVQLPSWSCPEVVQKLIKRFDGYLLTELDNMWKDHEVVVESNLLREQIESSRRRGHTHHPSLQSVSSAITDVSILSAQTDLNDLQLKPAHNYLPEA
jgi:hypothetical protein